jgi:hypothetical protein
MFPDYGDGNATLGECDSAGEADQTTADNNDLGAQLTCLF